ncbi:MAG: anti-sigma factor antagonist [Oscillospiraceae bacterium]|nr:anti-sigma factor antagonist [Oscillospiraceae bacterium]
MENVSHRVTDDTMTIFLRGHIDSANAPGVEKEINDIRESTPKSTVVLDCQELSYISSAGLRVILRLKKAVPDTSLINVSPDVYEIFDMTGFTEMMDIQKAYRIISVEGCEVIGQGANGKVYRIDPDTIVKVYLNPDALPEIHRERELARTAFVLGVPTAIPYDVVRIEGGGYGSVFELLNATSFGKLLSKGEKSVDEVAKMSIDLLKLIHSTVVKPGSMPDMKAVALDWADFLKDYLPEDKYSKLHELVAAVPEDYHMMHGDYHIKNVMLQNGESLLIDMDTLCHGHPIFELASMYNAYCGFSELDHSISQSFLGISHEMAEEFWNKSLRLYLDGADEETVKSVEEKAQIVGYTRIMRRRIRRDGFGSEEGRREIENCRRHLEELLPKVDTLLF